jgi:hypothetical protein
MYIIDETGKKWDQIHAVIINGASLVPHSFNNILKIKLLKINKDGYEIEHRTKATEIRAKKSPSIKKVCKEMGWQLVEEKELLPKAQ